MFTKVRDSAPNKSTFPKCEWKYSYRPHSSQISNSQKQKNNHEKSPERELGRRTYETTSSYNTSRSSTRINEFNSKNTQSDLAIIQDLVKGLQQIQRKSEAVENEYKEKLEVANLLNEHLKNQLEQADQKNFKMSQEVEQLKKEKQELKEMLREAQDFIFSNQLTDLHKQFSSQSASQKKL